MVRDMSVACTLANALGIYIIATIHLRFVVRYNQDANAIQLLSREM